LSLHNTPTPAPRTENDGAETTNQNNGILFLECLLRKRNAHCRRCATSANGAFRVPPKSFLDAQLFRTNRKQPKICPNLPHWTTIVPNRAPV
jgi:hypothetical protein